MQPIVSFKNVKKRFGSIEVLRSVSFDVQPGQVVALIGRSGSGKSTALRCIDRLETVDDGEIAVCGRNLTNASLDLQALRRDVGIVFQSYNLFPHLTVAQNVALAPRRVLGMSRAVASKLSEGVLAKVGLADRANQYPEQLSGGQQQRAAIARTLAMNPKLILFDEVTSALDPELTAEVLKVMEALARDGMTMVLVTHEMDFARSIADQVLFMHHGRVHEAGGAEILTCPRTSELAQFIRGGMATEQSTQVQNSRE